MLGMKSMAVLPTCTMIGPNGNTVVVNKDDRDSYLKRGYEYKEDNPTIGSPGAAIEVKAFEERNEAHQEKIANAVESNSPKAEADNSESGGDSEASGVGDDFDAFDDDDGA